MKKISPIIKKKPRTLNNIDRTKAFKQNEITK